jgi:hypothetical protein
MHSTRPGAGTLSEPVPPVAPGPTVMLLSLWSAGGGDWHARLVALDASVHEFTSPFELARFLAQPPHRAKADESRSLK